MTTTVTIARSGGDLVISDTGATFRLAQGGLGKVVEAMRINRAPASRGIDGNEMTDFSLDESALTVIVHLLGATWADIEAAYAELRAACVRGSYDVTRAVAGGAAVTWESGPCLPVPTEADLPAGNVAACIDTYSVTFPFFNPNPL